MTLRAPSSEPPGDGMARPWVQTALRRGRVSGARDREGLA